MAISEEKRSRVESHLYPVKEGQRYINLNPSRFEKITPGVHDKFFHSLFYLAYTEQQSIASIIIIIITETCKALPTGAQRRRTIQCQ